MRSNRFQGEISKYHQWTGQPIRHWSVSQVANGQILIFLCEKRWHNSVVWTKVQQNLYLIWLFRLNFTPFLYKEPHTKLSLVWLTATFSAVKHHRYNNLKSRTNNPDGFQVDKGAHLPPIVSVSLSKPPSRHQVQHGCCCCNAVSLCGLKQITAVVRHWGCKLVRHQMTQRMQWDSQCGTRCLDEMSWRERVCL